jgi:hypothetical protein
MIDENDYMKQLDDMKSQLYQIKVLLLILINLCLFGFYGISRSMWDDIAGTVTTVIEIMMVPVILISLVVLINLKREYVSRPKTNPKINEES